MSHEYIIIFGQIYSCEEYLIDTILLNLIQSHIV